MPLGRLPGGPMNPIGGQNGQPGSFYSNQWVPPIVQKFMPGNGQVFPMSPGLQRLRGNFPGLPFGGTAGQPSPVGSGQMGGPLIGGPPNTGGFNQPMVGPGYVQPMGGGQGFPQPFGGAKFGQPMGGAGYGQPVAGTGYAQPIGGSGYGQSMGGAGFPQLPGPAGGIGYGSQAAPAQPVKKGGIKDLIARFMSKRQG